MSAEKVVQKEMVLHTQLIGIRFVDILLSSAEKGTHSHFS